MSRARQGLTFERFLFDEAPDALLVYDVELGRFIDANPAAARLFECSIEELLAIGPEAIHRDDDETVDGVRMLIQETSNRALSGHHVMHELWLRTLKGNRRCCETRLVRLKGVSGRLIRVSYIDVTDRLQAQIALHEGKAVLAEMAKHSQAIVDNVLEAIVTADADGKIRSFNRAATKIFGYRADEVIGQNLSILMPQAEQARHQRHMSRYEATRRPHVIGVGREDFGRHKSGRVFPIFLSVAAIEGEGRPSYVGLIRDISQARDAQARIERLAFFDSLTGLSNRSALMDRIQACVAAMEQRGGHALLICADLDQFKSVNNTLGHGTGDQLLRSVGAKFAQCVEQDGCVARLGGDEFAILIDRLGPDAELAYQQASVWCQRLMQIVRDRHDLMGHEYRISASMGAAVFGGSGHAPEELLRRADMAMHQAKAESRDTYRFFDQALAEAARDKAALLNDLRLALPRGELVLAYQPQVDHAGRVHGAEALIRWKHAVRGLVSPGEFIPIAEQSGFVIEIGHWVLRQACDMLARWRRDSSTEKLSLAVNISATEFRDPDFVASLSRALAVSGADPRRLKLELTESVLAVDLAELAHKLTVLKQLGVSLSLDDFGTGYSSIAYLRELPLDQLKIDRSFIVDIANNRRDEVLVRGMVEMCKLLGLSVIVEGVETEAQRERLLACGCRSFQGYLTGRPMSADDLRARLATDTCEAA
ncbi:MAG: EAL domain-containing protein [Paucibacter sp.]|nr:EAL domain-containing protein [Roseateles sp.]